MITVLPVKSEEELKELYKDYNIKFNENSSATVAREKDEFLGCCLYDIDNEKIVINCLVPKDDIMLADGILRSALHIADYRGIENAFYSDTAPENVFQLLDFVKDTTQKSLKIEKLHESSCSCQKNSK